MSKKNILLLSALALAISIAAYFLFRAKPEQLEEISVEKGAFLVTVSSAGTVGPENKISIISPINGRIDRILVEEGDPVKKGQVLAWMSSTDRAALLDSAQAQGAKVLKEWADVYKATPILSPAGGVIISKSIVVGQTVSQTTSLFDLSDRLVVIADVDETDLGKIRIGQEARVSVDSFPGLVVATKVSRIAHQSKVKNSINTYEVLLLPERIPEEFRAGLTASVQFIFEQKEEALLLPTYVAEGRENSTLELKVKGEESPRQVKVGLSNGRSVEVLDGLKAGDVVLLKKQDILGEKPSTVFGVGGSRRGGRR